MYSSNWILFSSHVRTTGYKEQAFHRHQHLKVVTIDFVSQLSWNESEKAWKSYCIKVPEEESANQNNNQVVKNENTMGSPTQVTVNASNGGQVEYNVETKSHDDTDFKMIKIIT